MQDRDIENRPDLNTGSEWSEMDLLDLANCLRLHRRVEEIASFMCRSRREVREKMAELGRSGELQQWVERSEADVEKAAAEAPPKTAEHETEEIGFGEHTEDEPFAEKKGGRHGE